MEKVANHQSVDWLEYFQSIQQECPWSLRAYTKGKLDIVEYQGVNIPLGDFQARMYVISAPDHTVEAIADMWNRADSECEWLYSYPGYGAYATPVSVLIQQNRAELTRLRSHIKDDI